MRTPESLLYSVIIYGRNHRQMGYGKLVLQIMRRIYWEILCLLMRLQLAQY